jgi:raffinose/stachyose/melibiose transport system permease protein
MLRMTGSSRSLARKNIFFTVLLFVFLACYALLDLFPFLWTILSSFKGNDDIFNRPFLLPTEFKAAVNYSSAWRIARIGRSFLNTLMITGISTLVTVVIVAMASYIFARVRPLKLLYAYYSMGIMIPLQATLLPIFIMGRRLGILNTPTIIILVFVSFHIAFSTMVVVGFMRAIPRDLEEAAVMDGCRRNAIFFRIIFPMSSPALVTVGILAFIDSWNSFLIPLILNTNQRWVVVSQAVQNLKGLFTNDYGMVTAGVVISFLPLVLIYLVMQERVIAGMTAGAVKG